MCKNIILVMVLIPLILTGCRSTSGRYIRPMLKASSQGDAAELADLVRHGGDVNAISSRGWAPLHMAAGSGALSTVEWLVQNGAVVDLPNKQGQTALCIASGLGHAHVVRYLIARQADVHAGFPLYLACRHGDVETVQALLDAGCDPNRRSSVSTLTPAHVAAALGHADVLAALVRAGADMSLPGTVGEETVTPEDVVNANSVHREALLEALHPPPADDKDGDLESRQGSNMIQANTPGTGARERRDEGNAVMRMDGHELAAGDSKGSLVRIDYPRIRELASRAIARVRPELDLADYDPGYVLCLTHPDVYPFISVVAEWLGRKPLEVQKGASTSGDRVRVAKLSVKLSMNGELVEIRVSDAWLFRNR